MISLIVYIVVIGLVVWLVNTYTPIPKPFKTIVLVVGVLCAILLALRAFGVLGGGDVPVPQVR